MDFDNSRELHMITDRRVMQQKDRQRQGLLTAGEVGKDQGPLPSLITAL